MDTGLVSMLVVIAMKICRMLLAAVGWCSPRPRWRLARVSVPSPRTPPPSWPTQHLKLGENYFNGSNQTFVVAEPVLCCGETEVQNWCRKYSEIMGFLQNLIPCFWASVLKLIGESVHLNDGTPACPVPPLVV